MRSILLEIITPEKLFYRDEVEMVMVEETLGKEGYMAGHSPVLKRLEKGEVKIREANSGEVKTAVIPGGYIHVDRNIVIYTKDADWKNEI